MKKRVTPFRLAYQMPIHPDTLLFKESRKHYDKDLFYMGTLHRGNIITHTIVMKPGTWGLLTEKARVYLKKKFPNLPEEQYGIMVWSNSDMWFQYVGRHNLSISLAPLNDYRLAERYLARIKKCA